MGALLKLREEMKVQKRHQEPLSEFVTLAIETYGKNISVKALSKDEFERHKFFSFLRNVVSGVQKVPEDYSISRAISKEEAEPIIEGAKTFLNRIKRALDEVGGKCLKE